MPSQQTHVIIFMISFVTIKIMTIWFENTLYQWNDRRRRRRRRWKHNNVTDCFEVLGIWSAATRHTDKWSDNYMYIYVMNVMRQFMVWDHRTLPKSIKLNDPKFFGSAFTLDVTCNGYIHVAVYEISREKRISCKTINTSLAKSAKKKVPINSDPSP